MSRLHLCVDAIFYMFTGFSGTRKYDYYIIYREEVIVNLLKRLAPLTIIAKCLHACMQWILQLISTACAIPDFMIYISTTDFFLTQGRPEETFFCII